MKRPIVTLALIASVVTAQCGPASAQVAVIDVASIQKSVQEISNQLQQLTNEATQIELMRSQLTSAQTLAQALPNPTWSQALNNIAQLQQIISHEQGIVLNQANAATQFQNLYPGYNSPDQFVNTSEKWYYATMNAEQGVVQNASNILRQQGSSADPTSDLGALAQEESQVATARGQTAVIQAAATIAAQQVEQLNKLLTLDSQESSAEAIYRTQVAAERAQKDALNTGFSLWVQGRAPTTPVQSPQPR